MPFRTGRPQTQRSTHPLLQTPRCEGGRGCRCASRTAARQARTRSFQPPLVLFASPSRPAPRQELPPRKILSPVARVTASESCAQHAVRGATPRCRSPPAKRGERGAPHVRSSRSPKTGGPDPTSGRALPPSRPARQSPSHAGDPAPRETSPIRVSEPSPPVLRSPHAAVSARPPSHVWRPSPPSSPPTAATSAAQVLRPHPRWPSLCWRGLA
mmetsp:Transcript_14963/g.41233  ORF Transcript_14963/g.41233 Transcript_14963/m.41233 type:complete len:213 (+) Transcript_14963:205-843(+)